MNKTTLLTGIFSLAFVTSVYAAVVNSVDTYFGHINIVKDCGADPTGTTDSTAAIQACITAAPAGAVLDIPEGIFDVSSFSQLTSAITFRGTNDGKSIIKTHSATANVFDANAQNIIFEHIIFDSSVTRTAGSFVWFDTNAGYGRFSHSFARHYFTGVRISGPASDKIIDSVLDTPASNGTAVLIDGGNEHFLESVEIGGNATNSTGIEMKNCTSAQFTDVNVLLNVDDLLIDPASSQEVDNTKIVDSFFDSAVSHAVHIHPSGTGKVINNQFNGGWGSTAGSQNVLIDSAVGWTGLVAGTTFRDFDSQGSSAEGYYDTVGQGTAIYGGHCFGNTNSCAYFGGTATKFHVTGVFASDETGVYSANGRYGVEVANTSADHYIIALNHLQGNTLGAILDSGTGADKVVCANVGSTLTCGSGGGGGTVNSGAAYQMAQYQSSGTAVSPVSIPNCPDTGGNHLNFNSSTGAFTCGTSSSGGGGSGSVVAWAEFNGTSSSPITPRANLNISSVTKNGTGDYTVNFTSALADANYACAITANSGSSADYYATGPSQATPTASAFRFHVANPGIALQDAGYVNIICTR
jgi:pectate lyase-like protein